MAEVPSIDIFLTNTLTRRKERFEPLRPPEVRMYVCGPTVYNYVHIGNARVAVVFDVLYRFLRAMGYRVTYVHNYTDVDDKILRAAEESGEPPERIAAKFIRAYEEDMAALGVLPATVRPRATEHIHDMVRLIERLIARGMAYVVDGDVYFRVRAFPEYGKLSGQPPEKLLAGARVEVDPRKEDPLDFALWKKAKPGEPTWDAPWSAGRPGWHIECSAMSMKYLGETFDIHGGGEDLIFPHHENEIAQSEGATGNPFVRVWMHVGFVTVGDEKMSKSLGNVVLVRDLLRQSEGSAIRLFLLGTHYRSPLVFRFEAIVQAEQALFRLRLAYAEAERALEGKGIEAKEEDVAGLLRPFWEALADDLNTPNALKVLYETARSVYSLLKLEDQEGRQRLAAVREALRRMADVLGIDLSLSDVELTEEEAALLAEREKARQARDFAKADSLREELVRRGLIVEDTPTGTRVRRRRS
ncbi:cysteine--tRNA ligase [Brockia lithotrophica]|uniref:Cysteine--tRNA ligase n=1 Tax=Brockia lithotrophica TaxID=933949 RepID=A0A660KY89_9BACL|nr:cysteine--tRNA ligase [Brockia lithotrophica]RKQ85589.1 cysteinyl-tRNA synthetase [Brockia lithotrophica]